jgi:hypothetical protein
MGGSGFISRGDIKVYAGGTIRRTFLIFIGIPPFLIWIIMWKW